MSNRDEDRFEDEDYDRVTVPCSEPEVPGTTGAATSLGSSVSAPSAIAPAPLPVARTTLDPS